MDRRSVFKALLALPLGLIPAKVAGGLVRKIDHKRVGEVEVTRITEWGCALDVKPLEESEEMRKYLRELKEREVVIPIKFIPQPHPEHVQIKLELDAKAFQEALEKAQREVELFGNVGLRYELQPGGRACGS